VQHNIGGILLHAVQPSVTWAEQQPTPLPYPIIYKKKLLQAGAHCTQVISLYYSLLSMNFIE